MATQFSSRQRLVLWLACSAVFFEAFDVSIVNLALPVMARDLHITLAETQWVQTLYLICLGGFLLPGGRLCDVMGSRTVFLIGMTLFAGASALGACSHSLPLLLIARAVQGGGAALAIPGGISLLSRYFPDGRQRQTAMGIFGAFAAVGFAGGLALGGLIAAMLDWHWIFGVNPPIIAPVLAICCWMIPRETTQTNAKPSLLTACWLTATLLLCCYTIDQLPFLKWLAMPCIAVAVVSGFTLIGYDRRRNDPFFPKQLYPDTANHRSLSVSAIFGAAFLGFIFLITAAFYQIMRWDARSTGWVLFPYSIASALVSKFLLPVLFRKLGMTGVAQLALISMLAGLLLLITGICTGNIIYLLLALLLVNSFSIAIGYPALSVLSLSGVEARNQGIAAGMQAAIYTTGTGVGLSVIGLCLLANANDAAATQLSIPCMVMALITTIGVIILCSKPAAPTAA